MMYGHTNSKSLDQPGKVANPGRGQLDRENEYFRPRSCLRIWFRETGSAALSRVSLLIPILRLNLVLVCVCVCVFIKLHITAQSGLVILVILCHSR